MKYPRIPEQLGSGRFKSRDYQGPSRPGSPHPVITQAANPMSLNWPYFPGLIADLVVDRDQVPVVQHLDSIENRLSASASRRRLARVCLDPHLGWSPTSIIVTSQFVESSQPKFPGRFTSLQDFFAPLSFRIQISSPIPVSGLGESIRQLAVGESERKRSCSERYAPLGGSCSPHCRRIRVGVAVDERRKEIRESAPATTVTSFSARSSDSIVAVPVTGMPLLPSTKSLPRPGATPVHVLSSSAHTAAIAIAAASHALQLSAFGMLRGDVERERSKAHHRHEQKGDEHSVGTAVIANEPLERPPHPPHGILPVAVSLIGLPSAVLNHSETEPGETVMVVVATPEPPTQVVALYIDRCCRPIDETRNGTGLVFASLTTSASSE